MCYVPQLVISEFQQAHDLLYNELFFQAQDLTPMQSWKLRDDLDQQGFRESWLTDPTNADLTDRATLALFRRIQEDADLQAMFLIEGPSGSFTLDQKAIDIYEAQAQEFLKRLLVLIHITAGQALREPELLSVTWCNTSRQRHIFLWEKLVMLYTQYHKGQLQSGVYKDNVRFLPKPIGDLLLDYLAYVLPLRQMFLRQRTPGALISPYLWSKLDSSVFHDGTISTCLSKACARAMVPRLHISNWRHISASTCKEKFSTKEQVNFDLRSGQDLEDIDEEELDLVVLAEHGNHSYPTFNRAYAGSTTLTMNALLHRGHRASALWQGLFQFESILRPKRARPASGTLSLRMSDAYKRSQVRKRLAYPKSTLLAVAQKLYNQPNLQWRTTGQRDGILAIMGPQPAEQVVVVLGTGSGKSLIFMVGAVAADARTTILILPAVALRADMHRRCLLAGIRPLVWSLGSGQHASLVMVSAEAACTESFLEYAHGLVHRQQLDRIVIDECHLTVTANDYRPCMSQLGWHLQQIRTQTVWLTATLPPVLQETFIEHNKLVRPRVIRESTNRPNIRYMINLVDAEGTLIEKAAQLVRICWPRKDIFDHAKDKIIIYCRTRDEVRELQEILKCPAFTSESGSEQEKAAIITAWLSDPNQPVIVATSALSIGFDYPHVRWVIHLGAPSKMSSFSQESGRAGRDGQFATSLVILHSTWKPWTDGSLCPDKEAMQLYLARLHCYRGILSQFLDAESDWRWCMANEEPCQMCRGQGRTDARPAGLKFSLPSLAKEEVFTGPAEVLRQDHLQDQALDRYEQDFRLMVGPCANELLTPLRLDPCQERGMPGTEKGREGVDREVRSLLALLPATAHLPGC
jgi:superfamily II DNA helicase RecQ